MFASVQQGIERRARARSAPPACTSPSGSSSPAGARASASPTAHEVLNFCANNYLGLADDPRIVDGGQGGAGPLGLRHGQRPVHLRHPGRAQAAGAAPLARSSAPRTRSCTRSCFDANGGPVRDAARRAGRGDQRRAEPRLDHRRHPAVQGPAAALPQPRHGRPRSAARGQPGCAAAAHRHRRRVLHGRLRRAAATRSATWPSATTRWSWSTTRTRSGSSARRGRGTPELHGVERPGRHRHRDAGQGAGRGQRRLHQRAARRSSTCCGSGRGRTCSRTPSRPRWSGPRWRCSTCWRAATTCGPGCARTPPGSASG